MASASNGVAATTVTAHPSLDIVSHKTNSVVIKATDDEEDGFRNKVGVFGPDERNAGMPYFQSAATGVWVTIDKPTGKLVAYPDPTNLCSCGPHYATSTDGINSAISIVTNAFRGEKFPSIERFYDLENSIPARADTDLSGTDLERFAASAKEYQKNPSARLGVSPSQRTTAFATGVSEVARTAPPPIKLSPGRN